MILPFCRTSHVQLCILFAVLARSEPLGCFQYGYAYSTMLHNISGNPFDSADVASCQTLCNGTPTCSNFAFFPVHKKCFLGGADAMLRSAQPGTIAGPKTCPAVSQACTGNPSSSFPAQDAAQAMQVWPGGEEPTSLQCWPRASNGLPMRCLNQTATILEDTETGWSGRCEGLRQITDLTPGETCQIRCMMAPLCSVWMEETSSGALRCWHGMLGDRCHQLTGAIKPSRAQRLQHGTYRVLANIAGMRLEGLVQTFNTSVYGTWGEGAKHCKFECRSFLACQFWQYSMTKGCYISDPRKGNVHYPLTTGGQSPSVIATSDSDWVAGEMIQHNCVGPMSPLPTAPPTPGVSQVVVKGFPAAQPNEGVEIPSFQDEEQKDGMPFWMTALIFLAIICCIAVIVGAVVMGYEDHQRRKDRERGVMGAFGGGRFAHQDQLEQRSLLQGVAMQPMQLAPPNLSMPWPGPRQQQQPTYQQFPQQPTYQQFPTGPGYGNQELNAAAHSMSRGGRFM